MLCKNPFVRDPSGRVFKRYALSGNIDVALDGVPFPCGQCLPCRINKRRLWTHRLILESYAHDASCFVTLTYAPDYLPKDSSIHKEHVQLFIKRLRKSLQPKKIRYYFCGEYGPHTLRPHYHGIIFGLSLDYSNLIARCWPLGFSLTGDCNFNTIQYVAGYVTKKFVKKNDSKNKEFSIMSRRPGLGFESLRKFVDLLGDKRFSNLFTSPRGIPSYLVINGRKMPFDRFCKNKIELLLDFEHDTSAYIRELAIKYFQSLHTFSDSGQPLVDSLLAESRGRNLQIEARHKIFSRSTL